MAFFNSAVGVLQTLVIALGAGLGIWGVINLLEGYGSDNPGAKLQESKQMIRENNLNFTEIAAALQYSTVHHFSRQFKEKFGITPTEYARSVR